MNATDYFEKSEKSRENPKVAPNSESFWTSMFVFYLLHSKTLKLRLWRPMSNKNIKPPWYTPATPPELDLSDVFFNNISVEPRGLEKMFANIGPEIGGIDPDIIIQTDKETLLIENKITTAARLNSNQCKIYSKAIDHMVRSGENAKLLLLQSYGCSSVLYKQSSQLSESLMNRFAILLWEDVFLSMERSNFALKGFDPGNLLEYIKYAEQECEGW